MFKFNFSSQGASESDSQPSSLEEKFEAAVEEISAQEARYVGLHDRVTIGDTITLLKAQLSTTQAASLLGTVALNSSDLLPGQYEGGFKVWEGGIDLAQYVSKLWGLEPQGGQQAQQEGAELGSRGLAAGQVGCRQPVRGSKHGEGKGEKSDEGAGQGGAGGRAGSRGAGGGRHPRSSKRAKKAAGGGGGVGGATPLRGMRVLELGCGHGLPGLVALLAGAEVHFQDYNKEVLQSVTIPNVAANWGAWQLRGSCPPGAAPPSQASAPAGGQQGAMWAEASAPPVSARSSDKLRQAERAAAAPLREVAAAVSRGGVRAGVQAAVQIRGTEALQTSIERSVATGLERLLELRDQAQAFKSDLAEAEAVAGDAGVPADLRTQSAALAQQMRDRVGPRLMEEFEQVQGVVGPLLEVQRGVREGLQQAEGVGREQAALAAAAREALGELEGLRRGGEGEVRGGSQSSDGGGGGRHSNSGAEEGKGGDPAPPAVYFSGGWEGLGEVLEGRGLGQGYDVILSAETIYSLDSMRSLYRCIRKCLKRRGGVAYLAAKSYYFGVGGGTAAFLQLVEREGEMEGEVVRVIDDGVSNKREILSLRSLR